MKAYRIFPALLTVCLFFITSCTKEKEHTEEQNNDIHIRIMDRAGDYVLESHTHKYKTPAASSVKLRYKDDYLHLLDYLCYFINEKYKDQEVSQDTIKRYIVRITNTESTHVLSSADEIPGFKREQLDPDLRNIQIGKTHLQEEGRNIHIFYTYSQIGGVLKRYQVQMRGTRLVSCKVWMLDHGIGDALYLE